MPNGGSDCCGTCWFNRKNEGEYGYSHAQNNEQAYCEIRDIEIDEPFWTYCANHPDRSPSRDEIPLGPITSGATRGIWKASPDSEKIRKHLLFLLTQIEEQPNHEYPVGIFRDEIVVWQIGDFKEERGIKELKRISKFNPDATTGEPFHRIRESLIALTREAIGKIRG